MDNSNLTHAEELIFAEVTAALSEVATKEYSDLKSQYDAGTLDPNDMASSFENIFESQSELLHRYADLKKSISVVLDFEAIAGSGCCIEEVTDMKSYGKFYATVLGVLAYDFLSFWVLSIFYVPPKGVIAFELLKSALFIPILIVGIVYLYKLITDAKRAVCCTLWACSINGD